jgi:hypothetical protein
MKRITARLTLFLILCALLTSAFSSAPIPEVKGAEQVFFQDNFENYDAGTFPSSGGWELWYNGAGTEQQVIVDSVSFSPTKSLKLLGLDFWAGFAAKRFTSSSQVIGFEVAVRVEETNGQSRDNARVSFTKKVSGSISREYAPVTFHDDGTIGSGGQVLQSYVADTWYKIKLVMDRSRETYSVWVDGELKGENLHVTTTQGDSSAYPSSEIDAFSVSQCYNSVTVYFDDVKVFSAFDANPRLELVPNKGIAATTLVGSGFAPNSRISVTWDGIPVPTVPSPLITDGYGNFTAIISVLDQTNGTYTIRAIDELGNEAAATFTVNLEVPSQPQPTVPEDTALVISVLSPENTTYSNADVPLEYTVNRAVYSTIYSLDEQTNVTIIGNTTLTGLSEGPHSIVVYIADAQGNISASETVHFTVNTTIPDTSPPIISVTSPTNTTYSSGEIPLIFAVNEPTNMTCYTIDGEANVTLTGNTTLTGLADGTHQLTVYANCTEGSMDEFATVWFTVDTTPPNITDVVQAPVNVKGTLEDGVRVNATVTDALSGVQRVALNYSDGNETWVTNEMTKLEEDVWSGTIPAFPHGTNVTYTVIAEDMVGNTITSEELHGQPNQYEVLPEFLALITLPLLLIPTSCAVVIKKKTIIQSSLNKILQKIPQRLRS